MEIYINILIQHFAAWTVLDGFAVSSIALLDGNIFSFKKKPGIIMDNLDSNVNKHV